MSQSLLGYGVKKFFFKGRAIKALAPPPELNGRQNVVFFFKNKSFFLFLNGKAITKKEFSCGFPCQDENYIT